MGFHPMRAVSISASRSKTRTLLRVAWWSLHQDVIQNCGCIKAKSECATLVRRVRFPSPAPNQWVLTRHVASLRRCKRPAYAVEVRLLQHPPINYPHVSRLATNQDKGNWKEDAGSSPVVGSNFEMPV